MSVQDEFVGLLFGAHEFPPTDVTSYLEEITVEYVQNWPNKYNHRMCDSLGILAISVYPG